MGLFHTTYRGYNASWWFQPIWKILVKMKIFPKFRGEHKEICETNTLELHL